MAKIDSSGISYINRMLSTAVAPVFIFFVAAGKVDIINGWIYYGCFVLLNVFNIFFIWKKNVTLLNERGKTKNDIKPQDKVYTLLFLLFTWILPALLSGLQIRLSGANFFNPGLVAAGVVLLILSGILENWAMAANQFFERNIRIQNDRNHTVISNGPYKIIRHPGYSSYILRCLAFPLIIGALFSTLSIIAGIIVIILRTRFEDHVLETELAGYAEYKKTVKKRLIPFLW